ncbi:hypothetical protein BDV32DRAFT_34935 [Aspergillus pseudonomiae]|uniref:Uncharacterized protein n=1 Tax=Aspergillus pseudonomiae TaxID=1506151 RepID=A0A5N6IGZ2_9EURO|nr:uncharacterized protein BDV37DRAFT_87569 [Aspergillus pseudonomiae]KAB8265705.1 hypothetical protein BDV32DRAFT_34935 [Aspergillus pseudonomiae]KAE8405753.1 hypothetical protein BDV37DRAFT_87569 [Aspergillus pseudonomiae]
MYPAFCVLGWLFLCFLSFHYLDQSRTNFPYMIPYEVYMSSELRCIAVAEHSNLFLCGGWVVFLRRLYLPGHVFPFFMISPRLTQHEINELLAWMWHVAD